MEKIQTGLRMPKELRETLTREAKEQGYSLNAYLLMLIRLGRATESGRSASRIPKRTV